METKAKNKNTFTESFHNYKKWDFRIRSVVNNGIWSTIYKDIPTNNPNSPTGIKRLYLREKGWTYKDLDLLISETKSFIDNHESNLIQSLTRQKEKHHV